MIRRAFLRGVSGLVGLLPFIGKPKAAVMPPWITPRERKPVIRDIITAREHRLERALLAIECLAMHLADERQEGTDAERAMGQIYGIAHSAAGHCETCESWFEERISGLEKSLIADRTIGECPLCGKPAVSVDRPHLYCARMEQLLADQS